MGKIISLSGEVLSDHILELIPKDEFEWQKDHFKRLVIDGSEYELWWNKLNFDDKEDIAKFLNIAVKENWEIYLFYTQVLLKSKI